MVVSIGRGKGEAKLITFMVTSRLMNYVMLTKTKGLLSLPSP